MLLSAKIPYIQKMINKLIKQQMLCVVIANF